MLLPWFTFDTYLDFVRLSKTVYFLYSIAILQYLAAKHRTPDRWYPADLQKRARVDEFLSWQHTNIRTHGSKVFWFRVRVALLNIKPIICCVCVYWVNCDYASFLLAVFLLSLMHALSTVKLIFPNSRGSCLQSLGPRCLRRRWMLPWRTSTHLWKPLRTSFCRAGPL